LTNKDLTVEDINDLMRGLIEQYGPPAGAKGPVNMVEAFWGVKPDVKQAEILEAYGAGVRGITIRSGHGVGKTTVLSWAAINHILTRFPQKTVITAPSAGQLFDALYAEMVSWIGKLPDIIQDMLVVTATRIELKAAPKDSFISFRTARPEAPEALQGVHSEHVLLLIDEASGVPEAIFEAAIGSMSGHAATTMMASNPTKTSGLFYNSHMKATHADRWHRIHINCADSALVADDYEEEVALEYGRDSNQYRIRYLGEFPESDEDTIIARGLVNAAFDRDIHTAPDATCIWGLDVARFGKDATVLIKMQGREVVEIIEWSGLDTMETTGRVMAEVLAAPNMRRPAQIVVDSIGVGGGVVDRLRELGMPVRGINTSENPSSKETYLNLRAELWFRGQKWFEERKGRLPNNKQGQKLADQLCTPTYTYTSSGRIQVESKTNLVKRGFDSPNHADAFMLALAGAHTRMIQGRTINSGKPIKRNLKGIV